MLGQSTEPQRKAAGSYEGAEFRKSLKLWDRRKHAVGEQIAGQDDNPAHSQRRV
jgi:hypothetical protein